MIEVRQTEEFSAWLHGLSDRQRGRARSRPHSPHGAREIPVTPEASGRASWKCVFPTGLDTDFICTYLQRGAQTVSLLCGGDKRTQRRDIKRAQTLAETL